MAPSSPSLAQQLLRRRPTSGAPTAHGAGGHLKQSMGTFQLTMIGVGATVGTGIFFILAESVPKAGPAVMASFLVAGLAAGLAALCYAELASAVPVSGSSFSYAYTTLGELAAMVVAACLLLEYGVSAAAVAVGWSQYLDKLLVNLFGWHLPHAISAAPWDSADPAAPHPWLNLPAVLLIIMCAILLIRGTSESALVNTVMVLLKLAVLSVFAIIAFTAFHAGNFSDFAPFGVSGIGAAAGTIFFTYVGLDTVSTAGEEVKDPQRTMPRALIAALLIVTAFYLVVALAALGAATLERVREAVRRPGLDFGQGHRKHLCQYIPRGGRGDFDFLDHPGLDVRPDTHSLRDRPRRPAPVGLRTGQPPHADPGEQHDHRRRGGGLHGRLRTPGQPGEHGVDRNTYRLHRRIDRRHHPAGA